MSGTPQILAYIRTTDPTSAAQDFYVPKWKNPGRFIHRGQNFDLVSGDDYYNNYMACFDAGGKLTVLIGEQEVPYTFTKMGLRLHAEAGRRKST